MDQFNFIVSYLDNQGEKHDQEITLDSQDYKRHFEDNLSVLAHNYPPDQAEKHILATKKHYIEETIEKQLGGNTQVEYDVAEMINTLDRDIKGTL